MLLAILAFAFVPAAAPTAALAHGPTVQVSPSGVRPSQLAILAGDTVHFYNASSGGSVCTIAAEDGSFESPPLQRAEGWHHTFDEEGVYAFTLLESSAVRGTIVVGAPR